ncbi:MAG TPA: nucleoside diphosphate kinase regulator [Allosphingosinicella sp.]|nr:nucleoside diphosphate kinase regulator [Allosphingosinicella sp.]
MSATPHPASPKPEIHLSETDYDHIAALALRLEHQNPSLSALILEEIERAHLWPSDQLPDNVVTLGSEVEFYDDSNGARRRVCLVLPHEADIHADRVSVMTPVGAGLIGMVAGQEIDWPCPDGRPRKLRIIRVDRPTVSEDQKPNRP